MKYPMKCFPDCNNFLSQKQDCFPLRVIINEYSIYYTYTFTYTHTYARRDIRYF